MTANQKLKILREELQLSQDGLAKLIGVSRPTITRWEQGESIPLEKQKRIAKVLGVSTARVFDDDIVEDFEVTDMAKTITRIKDLYRQLPADAKLEVLKSMIDSGK